MFLPALVESFICWRLATKVISFIDVSPIRTVVVVSDAGVCNCKVLLEELSIPNQAPQTNITFCLATDQCSPHLWHSDHNDSP